MVIGFILVSTKPGTEQKVYNAILKMPDIVKVYPLFGEYNLLVKIDTRDFSTLGKIVIENINPIYGVICTTTLNCSCP